MVRFGWNLAQLFRYSSWSFDPGYTQIRQVNHYTFVKCYLIELLLKILLLLIPLSLNLLYFPCAPQVVYLSQGYPMGNTHFVTESCRFSRPLTLSNTLVTESYSFSRPLTLSIPCSISCLFLSRSDAPLHVFPFTLPPVLHRLRLKRRLINTGIKFLSVYFPNKVTGRPSSLLYDHLVLL